MPRHLPPLTRVARAGWRCRGGAVTGRGLAGGGAEPGGRGAAQPARQVPPRGQGEARLGILGPRPQLLLRQVRTARPPRTPHRPPRRTARPPTLRTARLVRGLRSPSLLPLFVSFTHLFFLRPFAPAMNPPPAGFGPAYARGLVRACVQACA